MTGVQTCALPILTVLYDPEGESFQGGQTAGPVAANILSEVLPYLDINKTGENVTTKEKTTATVPNVSSKTVAAARNILEEYGFHVNSNITGNESTSIVTDQMPKSGTLLEKDADVYLYTRRK